MTILIINFAWWMALCTCNDMRTLVEDLKNRLKSNVDINSGDGICRYLKFIVSFGLCTKKLCPYSIRWPRRTLHCWSCYSKFLSKNDLALLQGKVIFSNGNADDVLALRHARRGEVKWPSLLDFFFICHYLSPFYSFALLTCQPAKYQCPKSNTKIKWPPNSRSWRRKVVFL